MTWRYYQHLPTFQHGSNQATPLSSPSGSHLGAGSWELGHRIGRVWSSGAGWRPSDDRVVMAWTPGRFDDELHERLMEVSWKSHI